MYDHCKQLMHHHVLFNTTDGESFDGIILAVDTTNITVLVGENVMEDEMNDRQYGGYGYGHPPRRRYRRYRPRVFPLTGLLALSLLPYVTPYYPGYSPYPYY